MPGLEMPSGLPRGFVTFFATAGRPQIPLPRPPGGSAAGGTRERMILGASIVARSVNSWASQGASHCFAAFSAGNFAAACAFAAASCLPALSN